MWIVLKAYKKGLFAKHHLLSNILAGIIVGIVSLPLSMAFAIASGVSPIAGIYTSIVAGAIAAVFGGSLLQITGPTGAFVVILSGITAKYGMSGLQLATILAGVMLICMGVLRFGFILKYIPYSVISGFTSGVALLIFVGQWQNFLGLSGTFSSQFHYKLWQLLLSIPNIHIPTLIIGIFSLILLIIVPKIKFLKHIPATIIVLIFVTLLHGIFSFSGLATIGSAFGGISQGLPTFAIPSWDLTIIFELLLPGFTIAVLAAIQSLLSAVVADNMSATRHNSNRELIGQGLANIITPMFGGFAATGAIARTSTSIKNGATSPVAGLVNSLVLVLILLFLSPEVSYIPLTTLSAILFVESFNMSDIAYALKVLKTAPKVDAISLGLTFFLTVGVDLVTAVIVGVIFYNFARSKYVRQFRAGKKH
jgi:sulfate permease, SulP family